jgi:hypothetical protein
MNKPLTRKACVALPPRNIGLVEVGSRVEAKSQLEKDCCQKRCPKEGRDGDILEI